MRYPRLLTLFLAVATLALVLPASAGTTRRASQPLGAGAQFLPSTAVFYLGFDADPEQPQLQYLDRLSAVYLRAPEAEEAGRQLGGLAGGMSLEELRRGVQSWAGGEVFVALPEPQDLRRYAPLGDVLDDDESSCREPGVLVGAAIGDVSAFRTFVIAINERIATRVAPTTVEGHNGADIYSVGESAAGAAFYVGVDRGYALVSTSRSLLTAALDQDPSTSLAASPSFREAAGRLARGSLAFMFSNLSEDLFFGGGGIYQDAPVHWLAGALQLAPDSVRVDITSDVDSSALSRASRALLDKSRNPLRTAGIVPTETTFFVGWDNVKLIWDQIVEGVWPDAADYERFRRDSVEDTGLDPEDDIFGWMTGELALFVSPSREEDQNLKNIGIGLMIEAQDASLARQKLDKIVDAVRRGASSDGQPTTQEVEGISFHRIPLYADTALYAAVVNDWVLVTSSLSVAADTLAGMRGQGGLNADEDYAVVRSVLADPLQFFGYVNLPRLVAITTSAVGAAGGDVEGVDAYLRPIRGVGIAVDTTSERIDSSFFVHLVIPEDLPSFARTRESQRNSYFALPPILVDASKHGGAWWDADEETPAPQRFGSPPLPTRARPLAGFLADRVGARIERTVVPGQEVGSFAAFRAAGPSFEEARATVVEPREALIVRVGSEGEYSEAEIRAYQSYVRCGGALLLLSDGKGPGESDVLASAFGMQVAGIVEGEAVISTYAPHPITQGVPSLSVEGGTGLVGWDEFTLPIGFLSTGSYLDLNGNGQRDGGEPAGGPAAAVTRYGRGLVVFVGTTSVIEQPEHLLLDRVLGALLPAAKRPEAVAPDEYEPDNSFETAVLLPLDGTPQARTLHVSGDTDWFYFDLDAGEGVRLTAESRCPIQITIFAPDGATVVQMTGGSRLERRVTEGGIYYARVQTEGGLGTCESYQLVGDRLAPVAPDAYEPDDSAAQARPLALDGTPQVRSFHVADDSDWVSFQLSADDRVRVSTRGSCDTLLTLHASNGAELARDDDGGESLNARIDYTVSEGGIYYARVRLFSESSTCESYQLVGERLAGRG